MFVVIVVEPVEMWKTHFFPAALAVFAGKIQHFFVERAVEKFSLTPHIFINSRPTPTFQQFDIFLSGVYSIYSVLFLLDLFYNLLHLRLVAVDRADIRFHLFN